MERGVGQPLSMKLKNVHLPHPHPNGGFADPLLGKGMALLLVAGLSKVTTPAIATARDVPCGLMCCLDCELLQKENHTHTCHL